MEESVGSLEGGTSLFLRGGEETCGVGGAKGAEGFREEIGRTFSAVRTGFFSEEERMGEKTLEEAGDGSIFFSSFSFGVVEEEILTVLE